MTRRILLATAFFSATIGVAAATLPAGFTETILTSSLASPTAMVLAPDGRVFVCEQGGKLRVIKDGALLAAPFLTLTVDSNGERGLLGVVLDPNFPTNQYVYVYYTVPSPAHNRLSRFTADGDVAVAGSEVILLELDHLSSATNHNGGALHFGLDGKLFIASGNNANNANSQTLSNLLGKILRLNSDGTIPPDNPFVAMPPPARHEIWAYGLRNPFTFGIQPETGLIYVDDVGENTWEEINVGVSGANYGWSLCEGPCSPPNPLYTDPFFWYQHVNGQCAITAGDFYDPQVAQFPAQYVGKYFFADLCAGWIRYIDPTASGSPPPVTNFATGLASPVDIVGGYEGDLYYLARGGGGNSGVVSKVSYTGSNAPAITQDPASQLGSVGHPITFTVSASGAAPLAFQWQKDSADIPGATDSAYTIAILALSDGGHQYRCVVSNAFPPPATSAQATLTVTSNQPPTATINTPPPPTHYNAGDTIVYSGSGTDPETGTLPPSVMTWWVNFHHNTHFHPFIPPTSGITGGSFVIPVLGETSPNVWYRVHLSVVDPVGLTDEKYVDIQPNLSTMTLATDPSGLQLTIDGQPFLAPQDVVGVVNMTRTLGAPSPQGPRVFVSWSDGGAQTHDISTPPSDTTYTAVFGDAPTPTPTFTRTMTATPTATRTPTPSRTPTPTPTGAPVPSVSSISPSSGPAAGGTGVTITGTNFLQSPSGVLIGSVAASNVARVDEAHVTATVPALPAASLNDVWVTFPGLPTAILVKGWFADFLDVPASSLFHGDVEKVVRAGITAGCGAGNYCPTSLVTRAQMAVFLLKGEHGGDYVAPACASTIFGDVACPGAPFVDWINRLSDEGITGGCGGGNYCPSSPLTRAQMAVFLLKAEHGGGYAPPACAGTVFNDVVCPGAPFVDWINQLQAENITAGCGGGNYCPAASTPREQMATFLVRTFSLP